MSTRTARQVARGADDRPPTLHPTSRSDSPDAAVHAHVQDLGRICHTQRKSSSVAVWARRNIVVAFASFLVASVRTYLWTLVVSPASVLFDPLSTIATLVLYPVIAAGLAVLVAALYLFSLVGGRRIVNSLSAKYADGWSIVNWVRASCLSVWRAASAARRADSRFPSRRPTRPSLALAARRPFSMLVRLCKAMVRLKTSPLTLRRR